MALDSFRVSNFRVFGNDGTKVDFKPVTILTGTNSSGKSSFVKALVLIKDYIDKVRADFKKDGTFNPWNHRLDFTRADLKLKGFTSVLSRSAKEQDYITFSLELSNNILLGKIRTDFAFKKEPNTKGLDSGSLHSIKVFYEGDLVLSLVGTAERVSIESLNLSGGLFQSFIEYQMFCVLPHKLKSYIEIFDEDCGDDMQRLEKLQTLVTGKEELRDYTSSVKFNEYYEYEKNLRPRHDLLGAIESFVQTQSVFYFPILEKFRSVGKKESIRIIREEYQPFEECEFIFPGNPDSRVLRMYGSQKTVIESVISDFENSCFDSFVDYYRDLEDKELSSCSDKDRLYIKVIGKSTDIYQSVIAKELEVGIGDWCSCDTPFMGAYELLSSWQWHEDTDVKDSPYKSKGIIDRDSQPNESGHFSYSSKHILYDEFLNFFEYVIKRAIMPDDLSCINYFNGSFSTVQRLHSFEENSVLTRTVSNYVKNCSLLETTKSIKNRRKFIPGNFINKWLEELSVGKRLIIKTDKEGLGFNLFIKNRHREVESVADKGHGVTQIVSLLLLIENEILSNINANNHIKSVYFLDDEYFSAITKPVVIIEEPEVSMHPCMQSKLALMFEQANRYGVNFIIESHSEYLVRRTQAYVAQLRSDNEFNNNPFGVFYFNEDGSAYDMKYTRSGRFANQFGSGFFDEASKSSIEILKREKKIRDER